MSNDLPSPLRDLSVRFYLSLILEQINMLLKTHKESKGVQNAELINIRATLKQARDLMLRDDPTIKKYVGQYYSYLESVDVTSLYNCLSVEVDQATKDGNSIKLSDVASKCLNKATVVAIKGGNGSMYSKSVSRRIDIDPNSMARTWVHAALAMKKVRGFENALKRYLSAATVSPKLKKFATVVDARVSQDLAHVEKVKEFFKEATKKKRSGVAEDKRRKDCIKALDAIIRMRDDLSSYAKQQEDQSDAGGNAKEAEFVNHLQTFYSEAETWPPRVLLDLDSNGLILLDDLAGMFNTEDDAFDMTSQYLAVPDGNGGLSAVCRLTSMVARSMEITGKLNDASHQGKFEANINRMFEPYECKVTSHWSFPEKSDIREESIADRRLVEPFAPEKCERPAIYYTDHQGLETLIQKGMYFVPRSAPDMAWKLKSLATELKQPNCYDPVVENFDEMIRKLEGYNNFKKYWEDKTKDTDLIWSVMSSVTGLILIGPPARDTDNLQMSAKGVYDEFIKQGFYWETLDAEAVEKHRQPENPEWAIVPLPVKGDIEPNTPRVATHQPCGLKAPNGKFLLPPNKWLVVVPSLLKGYKLLGCLYRCESLRGQLIKGSPDWEGLKLWDEAVESHDHGEPDKDKLASMTVELFEAAYRRKSDEKNGDIYKKVARQLYRCLGELKVDLWPQLDNESLDFTKAQRDDIQKYTPSIEWIPDERTRGSIVRVDRFAFADRQGKIQLSLGATFSDRAKAWMDLFARIAAEDAAGPLAGLDSIPQKVNALPKSKSVDAQVDEIENELKEWLKSKEGEQALNVAMRQIRDDPHAPMSTLWIDLLKQIEQGEEGRVYPAFVIQEDRCEVSWPSGVPVAAPIDWKFDANIPVGQLVEQNATFSLDVARAAGTFSLGPESPASPISVAHGLVQIGETVSNSDLKGAANRLLVASIESRSTEQMPAEAAVQELAQLLTAEALWKDVGVDLHDQLLAGLRNWCNFFKWQISPKTFTYAEGTLPPGESEQIEAVFHEHIAVGQALVRQFGLLDPSGSAIVPEACKVSAGPAPAGYEELLKKLRAIDELKYLMDLAGRWPAQRLKSERALANAIKGEFFDELFKSLDALGGDERAVELQKTFAEILKSELSAFLFSPTRIRDVDDGWLKPVNRSETMSGKIKKVIKPGLRDNKGMLIAPAVVELD